MSRSERKRAGKWRRRPAVVMVFIGGDPPCKGERECGRMRAHAREGEGEGREGG